MSTDFSLGDAHRAVATDPALGLEHLTLNPDCDECEQFVQSIEQAAQFGSSRAHHVASGFVCVHCDRPPEDHPDDRCGGFEPPLLADESGSQGGSDV